MRDALMCWLLACADRWRGERGQTMAEYALILALITLVVIGAVTVLGTQIGTFFNEFVQAIQELP